jgi:hypothetical protein
MFIVKSQHIYLINNYTLFDYCFIFFKGKQTILDGAYYDSIVLTTELLRLNLR